MCIRFALSANRRLKFSGVTGRSGTLHQASYLLVRPAAGGSEPRPPVLFGTIRSILATAADGLLDVVQCKRLPQDGGYAGTFFRGRLRRKGGDDDGSLEHAGVLSAEPGNDLVGGEAGEEEIDHGGGEPALHEKLRRGHAIPHHDRLQPHPLDDGGQQAPDSGITVRHQYSSLM
jgi:hypothetical protein